MVGSKTNQQESTFVTITDQEIFESPPLPHLNLEAQIAQGNFTVDPAAGFIVSNPLNTSAIIYVPGILNEDPLPGAQLIANLRGRQVYTIENDTRGLFRDLACCGAFSISQGLGALAESKAVAATLEALDEQIRNNISPTIYAHSEGNFIVNEAIRQEMSLLMSRGYTLQQVKRIIEGIQIFRYGSPESAVSGVQSVEFEHSQDPVSKIGQLIDAKNTIMNLITGRMRDGNRSIRIRDKDVAFPIDISSHLITSYLENNPEFYDKSRELVTPQGRAFALYMSINEGFFSNPEFERIIQRMLTTSERYPGDRQAFARALMSFAPYAKINNYVFSQRSRQLLLDAAQ